MILRVLSKFSKMSYFFGLSLGVLVADARNKCVPKGFVVFPKQILSQHTPQQVVSGGFPIGNGYQKPPVGGC